LPGSHKALTSAPVTRAAAGLIFGLSLLVVGLLNPVIAASFEHRVEIDLQPASGEIRIQDQLEVEGIKEFRFRLATWLARIDVEVDGVKVELKHQGGDTVIDLPDIGVYQINFDLQGNVPTRDEENTRELTSSSAADGVYLPGYDGWIPHPAGMPMRYQLTVSVPGTQRAVVTGKLVDEQLSDNIYRANFVSTPFADAPSLFAGPYQMQERRSQELSLRSYFHAELADQADAYLDTAEDYIQRYQNSIGDYPYTDFSIVSAPLPVGLGFPGLTYVDRRIVPLPFMRSRSLAHEVLHNWWGNGVAVDYATGNWAEGLTTFMADYALQRDKGNAAARVMRVRWLRDYAALPGARDQPVRDFKSKQHQAAQVIGYNKVAFIFHMLSLEIGPQAFDRGIRDFWRKQRFASASWRHLQAAFEQAAGRQLDWFFRQWLDRKGAPQLSLGSHRVDVVEGAYRTRIEILQPASDYRFNLDVQLTTGKGIERRRLFIEDRLTHLQWITPGRPLSIQLDPQNNLFRRLQASETPPILRDITLNPATVTLIASEQPAFVASAQTLAARLLDNAPRVLGPGQSREPAQPLLLITSADRLAGQLERLQLQIPDELPDVRYGAATWTARLANNTPVLVVSAESTAQLQALLRPLPHYGGQSYVLFDGGRALNRGLWPLSRGALYRDLETAN
jgi:aminopeptidase N